MFIEAELHAAYKFGNCSVRQFPFSHFFIEDIFPQDFYEKIQENLPTPDQLSPISEKRPVKGYKERFVLTFDDASLEALDPAKKDFWTSFRDILLKGGIGNLLFNKFSAQISQRFKDKPGLEFRNEAYLVLDTTNYALGPHTDSASKVITVVFYMPPDKSQEMMGTSIYLPRNASFLCEGGPHYKHENFLKLATMPYVPNAVFGFLKSNNSFHGVEKLTNEDCKRWVLLFDIYAVQPKNK